MTTKRIMWIRRGVLIALLLMAMVVFSGCSGFTCMYGDCKQLHQVAMEAKVVAENPESTVPELAAELRVVADYYEDLYDNSQFLGGLYTSAGYREILIRAVASSAEGAHRAAVGELDKEEAVAVLGKFAAHLEMLRDATVAERSN